MCVCVHVRDRDGLLPGVHTMKASRGHQIGWHKAFTCHSPEEREVSSCPAMWLIIGRCEGREKYVECLVACMSKSDHLWAERWCYQNATDQCRKMWTVNGISWQKGRSYTHKVLDFSHYLFQIKIETWTGSDCMMSSMWFACRGSKPKGDGIRVTNDNETRLKGQRFLNGSF